MFHDSCAVHKCVKVELTTALRYNQKLRNFLLNVPGVPVSHKSAFFLKMFKMNTGMLIIKRVFLDYGLTQSSGLSRAVSFSCIMGSLLQALLWDIRTHSNMASMFSSYLFSLEATQSNMRP